MYKPPTTAATATWCGRTSLLFLSTSLFLVLFIWGVRIGVTLCIAVFASIASPEDHYLMYFTNSTKVQNEMRNVKTGKLVISYEIQ
jgi:hypothetical protein